MEQDGEWVKVEMEQEDEWVKVEMEPETTAKKEDDNKPIDQSEIILESAEISSRKSSDECEASFRDEPKRIINNI